MWGRKARRIADLEARLEVAQRKRESIPEPSWAPRRSVGDANRIHTLRVQRDAARQEAAIRAGKQVEYSNQAVANMRRLARALRACARYRAELADQAAVTDRLSDQLLNSIGYPPEYRALLNHPDTALTGEPPS
jgi:hypothetical protein